MGGIKLRPLGMVLLVLGTGCIGPRDLTVHNRNAEVLREPTVAVLTYNLLFAQPVFQDDDGESFETLDARLELVAREVARLEPDVVVLQEVSVSSDHGDVVERLISDVEARLGREGIYNSAYVGAHGSETIGWEEGEAVLSRFAIDDAVAIEFDAQHDTVTALGVPLLQEARRAIRVELRGQREPLVVVATHLTAADVDTAAEQAEELVDRLVPPRGDPRPVVVAGDLNSPPGSATLAAFAEAGFTDAWSDVRPDDPGWTYGHTSLRSRSPRATERIDYVLVRDARVQHAELFLDEPDTMPTREGPLWASDHTGVLAVVAPERGEVE